MTSVVQHVAVVYGMFLTCWSLVWSSLIDITWWAPFVSFLMIGSALWATHYAGHCHTLWKPWYMAHAIGHHVAAYPAVRFTSSAYVDNTLDVYNLNRWTYLTSGFITCLACVVLLVQHWTLAEFVALLGPTLLGIYIEEWVHYEIHIQGSWMERYTWFLQLRELHREHHRRKFCNYAVVGLYTDAMFGTLRMPLKLE